MSDVIKSWSYSSYSLFEQCRFAWKKRWIDGIKQEAYNPAFARGTEIHAKAEYLVKGKVKGMPKELKRFSYEFKELVRLGADAEADLTITRDQQPTVYNDWDNAWCRVKIDASIILGDVATVIDYKTGRKYGSNQEQCSLYALAYWRHHPEIVQADTELWYLDMDDDNVELHTYTLKDLNRLAKEWPKRVAPMFKKQKEYPPNPSKKCTWCAHAADKGGSCPYNSNGFKE